MSYRVDINKKNFDFDLTVVLCHGAGAGFKSEFLRRFSDELCELGVQVYQLTFSYMTKIEELGKRRPPSRMAILEQELLDAVDSIPSPHPVSIIGKSMGARVAFRSAASHGLPVVALGFPLIANPDKPDARLAELTDLNGNGLILQGERDRFGSFEYLSKIDQPANVSAIPDGDHDFKPRKASGTDTEANIKKAAQLSYDFIRRTIRN